MYKFTTLETLLGVKIWIRVIIFCGNSLITTVKTIYDEFDQQMSSRRTKKIFSNCSSNSIIRRLQVTVLVLTFNIPRKYEYQVDLRNSIAHLECSNRTADKDGLGCIKQFEWPVENAKMLWCKMLQPVVILSKVRRHLCNMMVRLYCKVGIQNSKAHS